MQNIYRLTDGAAPFKPKMGYYGNHLKLTTKPSGLTLGVAPRGTILLKDAENVKFCCLSVLPFQQLPCH